MVLAILATPAAADAVFSDVSVIVLPEGRIDARRDVLVRDARIERVAEHGARLAPDVQHIDGRGRFLMAGLTEAHAHVPGPRQEAYAYQVLSLYLAHGLTSIRGMLGDPWHLSLRDRLARGEVLGPRLFTAGPSLNGRSAPTPQVAESMVREQAAAGFDFLKLHPGLTREVFDALVASARKADITFQGHVSDEVGLDRALQAKQRAIDHLDGYVQALADPACVARAGAPGFFGINIVDCVNERRMAEVVRATRNAGTWMVPTQILLERWAQPPSEEALRTGPARLLPESVVTQWQKAQREFADGYAREPERARRFVALRRSLLRELHRAGVPVLLGSDAPQVFNVPGDSALEELALYVEIGMTPAEALSTATVNVARFFNATDRFGQVREGLDADLILLEANPLQDIRAVRRLAGVMVRGRWLPRKELEALKTLRAED